LGSESSIIDEVTIKGDFGKGFKIVLDPVRGTSAKGYAFYADTMSMRTPEFNVGVKTGYGCIKSFKEILSLSTKTDIFQRPRKLFLYNMALGESHLVLPVPQGVTFAQSMDKNMIWTYSVTFQVLADANTLRYKESKTSLEKLTAIMVIQDGINSLASNIKTML